ncbi:MAG: hypothetical protein IT371_08865 [Deltaproteobacteria bacterium]|nr:hypothetical protein [Deltaproteobacteria bacterium]
MNHALRRIGSLVAASLFLACGEEPVQAPPAARLDVTVDQRECRPGCTVNRYTVYVLKEGGHEGCIYREAPVTAQPDQVLAGLQLTAGSQIRVALAAYCGADRCAKCRANKPLTVADGAKLSLKLEMISDCKVDLPGDDRCP